MSLSLISRDTRLISDNGRCAIMSTMTAFSAGERHVTQVCLSQGSPQTKTPISIFRLALVPETDLKDTGDHKSVFYGTLCRMEGGCSSGDIVQYRALLESNHLPFHKQQGTLCEDSSSHTVPSMKFRFHAGSTAAVRVHKLNG